MRFWRNSTATTKIILFILFVVVVILTLLALNRFGVISIFGDPTPEATATVDSSAEAVNPTITDQVNQTTPEGTPAAAGTALVTATVDTPILRFPDEESEIIARLAAGQFAEVSGISRDGLWWQIIIPNADGAKGWVSSQNVIAENIENVPIVEPEAESPPQETESPETGGTVTADTNVNIRRGPGVQFEIVGLLDQGQSADVLGINREGTWWYISLPNRDEETGWVSDDFVTAENTDNVPIVDENGDPVPGQLPIPTPAPGTPSVTSLVNLNIRSGPGVGFDIIGLLLQGRKAQVVGASADNLWWAISIPSADNGRGWVSADFVVAENTDDVPVIESP